MQKMVPFSIPEGFLILSSPEQVLGLLLVERKVGDFGEIRFSNVLEESLGFGRKERDVDLIHRRCSRILDVLKTSWGERRRLRKNHESLSLALLGL